MLAVNAPGKYRVLTRLTRATDYGIVRLSVEGQPMGTPFDGFAAGTVLVSNELDLGVVELKKGANTLRIEVVGTNPSTTGARYMWGIDYVTLKPE
jgi:hypothetical protein